MELQIFKNNEFGSLRAIERNGEPWFVGKDVATALGYSNTGKAILMHVDEEDRKIQNSQNGNFKNIPNRGLQIINESGLYSLIMSSKLPTAKKFKHWVTSEVLPTIRKHGAYLTDQKAFDITHNANSLADLLEQASEQLRQKDIEIERMRPKEIFSDAVSTSKSYILIGELAKILKGNGIDIGQNKLFAWMRENGYLIKRKGTDYNMPTQRAMNQGLFKIKEGSIVHSDGHTSITKTVKVTGRGQVFFVNKFLKEARAAQ